MIGPPGSPQAAYLILKSETVFGYLSSPLLAPTLARFPIIPGRFDPCIPVRVSTP
jgi:hypothetical protein